MTFFCLHSAFVWWSFIICMALVSNIRPACQNQPDKDPNLARWQALENVEGIDFGLLTVVLNLMDIDNTAK